MNQVIIRLTFSNREFLTHLAKYVEYYDQFLMSRKNSNFYIENVQDGLIFFYQDYETLKRILEKEVKHDFENLDLTPLLKQSFFSRMIFPQKNFIPGDFEFTYQIIRGPESEIIPLAQKNFLQFDLSLQFSLIQDISKQGFVVKVESYNLILNYTKYLISKYIINQ